MSNDHMLLPQPGYVLPSPFAAYQSVPGIPQFPLIQPNNNFPVAPSPATSTSFFTRYNRLPSTTSLSSDQSEMGSKVVSWDELLALLPEVPAGRVESGLLPDGRAFAPKTARKDNYFLFPSKSDYIIYYTQYYFSRENLDRDQTMRGLMTASSSVPIEEIIKAPRLASIATTVDDMKKAIQTSSILLCIETDGDGRCFVKRKDGYPGNLSTRASFDSSVNAGFVEPSTSSPPTVTTEHQIRNDAPMPPTPGASSSFPTTSEIGAYLPHHPQHQQPLFIRPPSRPVAPNAAINSVAAAMAAMTFGQPPPPAPQHLFGHLPMQNQFAATLALLSQRGSSGLAFANPMTPYAVAPNRGGQQQVQPPPPHANQHPQQLYQHRRSPPPQTAFIYQFQPPHQFYPFHPPPSQSHEAAAGAQFAAAAFQPQPFDQWNTEAANAALAATGIQLQYIAAAAAQQQHHQQQQPLASAHHQPPAPPSMMVWQTRGPPQVSPAASTQTPAPVPPPTTRSTPSSTVIDTAAATDNNSDVPVGGGSVVHPCAKDDPSIVAVTEGGMPKAHQDVISGGLLPTVVSKMPVPQQPGVPTTPPLSQRPNSGGGGKTTKMKPSKGGGGGVHGRSAVAPVHASRNSSSLSATAAPKDQHTNHTNVTALATEE